MQRSQNRGGEVETLVHALERVTCTLRAVLDIVDERVDQAMAPGWCERRGWTEFLLGLSNAELERCERLGLCEFLPDRPEAPAELRDLATEVSQEIQLPSVSVAPKTLALACLRSVSERKQLQLALLLAAVEPMARKAARIVDVGAGSGHFTRLAAHMFQRSTLGLELNPERVARSEARTQAEPVPSLASFLLVDACRDSLGLARNDLAVGLHACGELGDRLVTSAAEANCDLALVSCCLQKLRSTLRTPLSRRIETVSLRKETLGLTNLTTQTRGVETTLSDNLRARETRYALGRLLRSRGALVEPGAEMRGINRRRAQSGLGDVAERAFRLRGLSPASPAEVREHEIQARREYAIVRRLSLPRNLLGRLIEVAVVLDRANALAEAGLSVRVATLVPQAITPRNIAVFASRTRERLPSLMS